MALDGAVDAKATENSDFQKDATGETQPQERTKISRDEYRKITVQILDYVRQNEERGPVESPAVVEW